MLRKLLRRSNLGGDLLRDNCLAGELLLCNLLTARFELEQLKLLNCLVNLLTTAWNNLVTKDWLRTWLFKELFRASCFLVGESFRHQVFSSLLIFQALVIFLLLFVIFLLILLLFHLLCFIFIGTGGILNVFLHRGIILKCDRWLRIRSEWCRMCRERQAGLLRRAKRGLRRAQGG